MSKHLANLRIAALAGHLRHEAREILRIADPFAGAGFTEAAEVNELYVNPSDLLYGAEHFSLEPKRKIPGRLAAHCCIHCEDEPPPTGARRGNDMHAGDEGIDLGATRLD
jgi:hypothetical protein